MSLSICSLGQVSYFTDVSSSLEDERRARKGYNAWLRLRKLTLRLKGVAGEDVGKMTLWDSKEKAGNAEDTGR